MRAAHARDAAIATLRNAEEQVLAAAAEWRGYLSSAAMDPVRLAAFAADLLRAEAAVRTAEGGAREAQDAWEARCGSWRMSEARMRQAEAAEDTSRRVRARAVENGALLEAESRATFLWSAQ